MKKNWLSCCNKKQHNACVKNTYYCYYYLLLVQSDKESFSNGRICILQWLPNRTSRNHMGIWCGLFKYDTDTINLYENLEKYIKNEKLKDIKDWVEKWRSVLSIEYFHAFKSFTIQTLRRFQLSFNHKVFYYSSHSQCL